MIRSNVSSSLSGSTELTVEVLRADGLSEERNDESKELKYIVYILRTSSNTLYIGQTNNLDKRIKEHQSKNTKSAKYIKYFDSCELVYSEEYLTRVEAMQREHQLKKRPRSKKDALISGTYGYTKESLNED